MKSIKNLVLGFSMLVASITFAQVKSENVSSDNGNAITEELLNSKFDNGVHVVAEISGTEMAFNDTLTITYKLYVSHDIGISNYKIEKDAVHKVFEVKNVELYNPKIEYEFFKNEKYRLVVLKTVILKPKQKGKFTLDTLELNITAEIATKSLDDFGHPVMKKVNRTIKTSPTTVNVI